MGKKSKQRSYDYPGQLGAWVAQGVVSSEEAFEIDSVPEVVERLENAGISPSRALRVARAIRKENVRRQYDMPRPHHTRYNKAVIDAIVARIGESKRILDPMAGTFERIRELEKKELGWHQVYGIELEEEWVSSYPHPRFQQGDARDMPFGDEFFDCIVVSPSYGNRDSDRTGEWWDNADRKTYAAALGRNVSAESLCVPFESDAYKRGHVLAWAECVRVLKVDGLFVINLKNHVKAGVIVPVSQWHRNVLRDTLRMTEIDDTSVPVSGRHSGANAAVRAESVEKVYFYQKQARSHVIADTIKKSLWEEDPQ